MAKLQKTLQKQNLAVVRVLIDDTDPSSRYFRLREVRDVLHGGRQGFLIQGAKELVNDSEILIELLDVNGETIFITTVRNYAEGRARFVSIEIYEDTPPGPATLTILGETALFANGDPIPGQWKGVFNVKWQKEFTVDTLRTNDSRIRVFQPPTLTVQEVLAPFRKVVTSSIQNVTGSGIDGANSNTAILNTSNTVPNIYTVSTPSTPISKSMEGGSFTASLDTGSAPGVAAGTVFTSSISSVFNDSTFQLETPLISDDGTRFSPFRNVTDYTISFQEVSEFNNTELTRSFADVELARLKTFSGDIARAKLLVKSEDSEGGFEFIADIRLEELELTQTASVTFGPTTRLGNFFTQSIVDAFWVGGTVTASSRPPYTISPVTLSRNTVNLIDSMQISSPDLRLEQSGSNIGPRFFMALTGSAFSPGGGTTGEVTLDFIKGLEYSFAADVLCKKINDSFAGKMDVYLSGSAFPSTSSLGTLVASYDCPVGEIQRLQRRAATITNFIPSADGTAKLFLVIHQGDWFVSDLSVFSSQETGFNPDCASFLIPVFGKRFERLQFKAQLFDPNNNEFPQEILSDFVFFNGGNVLFRGSDNRVEGTLTIAPSGSRAVILSTEGYRDTDDTEISGSVMAIGPEVGKPKFFDVDTPFFVASDPAGDPKISIANKLRGFVDPTTNEFILQIIGTILVGSGSNVTDIRSLLPRKPTDDFFHRIRGLNLDFFDIQGKKAITAGNVQSDSEANFIQSEQIVRMGKYTRGTVPRTVPTSSPLIVSGITGSIDPFSAPEVTVTIFNSSSLEVPADVIIWNNTLYGNMTVDIDEILLEANEGAYEVDFELQVDTSWVGFASGSFPGLDSKDLNLGGTRVVQTITIDDEFFITQTGSFSPDPFISYPIHIPEQRPVGFNTLFVVVRLIVSTTQA